MRPAALLHSPPMSSRSTTATVFPAASSLPAATSPPGSPAQNRHSEGARCCLSSAETVSGSDIRSPFADGYQVAQVRSSWPHGDGGAA